MLTTAFNQSRSSQGSHEQDKQFRSEVVGRSQVEIEKALITAKNGVWVLFTPTHGTPLMISENNDIPDGLIPKDKMDSYVSSVEPRVKTTHQMPKQGVKCIFIRHQLHRPQVDDKSKNVDETHYDAFLKQYPTIIVEKIISEDLYNAYADKNIPAAFYYWIENDKPQLAAIFGKQINQGNNKLLDPGVSRENHDDLALVNKMLHEVGLPSVDKIHSASTDEPERKRRKVVNP